ncbi:carboxymuconolactone decarboxylase family protein [Sphingobium sp. SJ10-10]|uniref:carboxymuconolactone decarboxylase family protein n=1 Tax=Sphingobium sp. SJ10-10 TaxID=3114999 RepID=UPI002E18F51A|nr:carboxymuconolactone decarboxylase family protein [Sphingobium sp. SJ10-10]
MDLLMLKSPVFTDGWNDFSRMLGNLSLPLQLRQFVMCVIGVANGAEYQVASHGPQFLAAGGRQEQLDALTDMPACFANENLFDEQERTASLLALEMTENVQVSDATFDAAVRAFDNEEKIVDLVGLIAAYNMISRFVVAFDIRPENGKL